MFENMKEKKRQREEEKAQREALREEWLNTDIGMSYIGYIETEEEIRRQKLIASYAYGESGGGDFVGSGGGDSCGGDGGGSD